ncbi:ankyrin repeat-containing protein, partial [Reticulomyxa filosa]
YYTRSLFIPDLPGYVKCEKALNSLLQLHLPRLQKYLESLGCLTAILSPWLHCLFAYPNIDPKITFYIWDLFLVKDFSIFLKVAFMICLVHVEKFIASDFIEIVEFCKSNDFLNESIIRACMYTKMNEAILKDCQSLFDGSLPISSEQREDTADASFNVYDIIQDIANDERQ